MDGRWWADDLATALTALSSIYAFALLSGGSRGYLRLTTLLDPFSPRFSQGSGERVAEVIRSVGKRGITSKERYLDDLELLSVRYSSPGLADLAGMGAAIGHVKDFLLKLIEIRRSARSQQIGDAILREDLIKRRLENLERFVGLVDRHNLDPYQRSVIVSHVWDNEIPLYSLVDRGLITDASVVDMPEET